jgi:hypothetical protein
MPADPLKECYPAKSVKRFHQFRKLVPVLLPQIQFIICVRVFLMIPLFILGCLGFCWGKDLFAHLNAGYNPVGTTRANARPQVAMQPTLGTVAVNATVQFTTQSQHQQMAQPLILNVPPTLPWAAATVPAPPPGQGDDTAHLLESQPLASA